MGLRTALFDLDGTLIDSEARSTALWRLTLDKHAIDHDARALIGRRAADVIPELFPGADVEEMFKEIFVSADHTGLPEIVPVPGAVELVRAIAGCGSPVGLVTSARRWWAEERLGELGVRDLIDTVVSAEDVTIGKPDPMGMRCVGVTTSHAVEELADADLVVADLTGIGWPPFTQGSSWSGPGTEGEAHG